MTIGAILATVVALNTVMPNDPFEDDEPKIVECRITFVTSNERPVGIDAYCSVGGDERDESAILDSPWIYRTTGHSGDEVSLAGVPSRRTTVTCEVFVNDVRVAIDEETDDLGCDLELVVM